MIRKLIAKHFEGIETAEVELGSITALYGMNGAGKSSLRDAIEHALTGEPCRGGVLADVIRQGAKAAEVEVLLDDSSPEGLSIIRRRSKSTGKQMVHGEELTAGEVQAAVEKTVGAPVKAIVAALRAGALLELKPDELQALLAGITGATFDEKAIAEALGTEAADAAGRSGLQLPKRFEELPSFGKAAEGARQHAKRQLAEREADFDRTPQGKPGDEGSLLASLKDLRARRERAARDGAHDAGARDEKLRRMRAELDGLQAVEQPAAANTGGSEEALARAEADAVRLRGRLDAEHARLEELRAKVGEDAEGDEQILARAEEIGARLASAKKTVAEATRRAEKLAAEGKQQKALLDRIPAAGCVGPCPVLPETECPLKDLSEIKARLAAGVDSLRAQWTEAAKGLQQAESDLHHAESDAKALQAAHERAETCGGIVGLEATIADLQTKVDAARAEADALRPQVEQRRAAIVAARRFAEAQEKASMLAAEVAALEKIPSAASNEDVGELDRQIADAERSLADIAQAERRQAVEAAVAKAKRSVADCDAVAQACKQARVKLLTAAVEPFTSAANQALAKLAPGYSVEVDDALEILVRKGDILLRPAQLSDGERTRLLYVIQYAVCRLAGVRLLPLDRMELLDDAGKQALKRLMAECTTARIQVLTMSCKEPPEAAPQGVTVYVVDGGRVRAVGRKAA